MHAQRSGPLRPKVLITRKIFEESIAHLARHCDVDANQRDVPLTPHELIRKLQGKQGAITLLTDTISDAVLARCPDLKIVSNVAVGFNNLDVKAATERGVMMTNTPGVLDDTTADFTWCLILAASRGLVDADRYFRSGRWKGWGLMQFLGRDIHGKTLGICGLGRIGRRVAKRAKGFDMRVLYTGRTRAPEKLERELGAAFVDKRTLLKESDIVTLHVPLTPDTTHYISTAELTLMKPTAVLVNTSRGPVVDEKALVRALREGRIASAGLDVYEREPRPASGLTRLKNVVLAPHIGSASMETRLRMSNMAAENCVAGLTGRRPPNLLNPQVLKGKYKRFTKVTPEQK
ncbi:MAG: D-glycerate dehydrogenase [Candidatus Methylomirabilis oxyfera]|nr:D-glycerate dehydrogenase [Candidatus Methylomirabilis oxyfera]